MNKLSKYIGKASPAHPITLRFHNGAIETFTSIERKFKGGTLIKAMDDKGNEGVYSASEMVSEVQVIDMTPKWADVILIHVTAYANTGNQSALSEIMRCARLADMVKGLRHDLEEANKEGCRVVK